VCQKIENLKYYIVNVFVLSGMNLWALVSGNLKLKSVACKVVWKHCLELFESFSDPLTLAEVS
jgi:hypothetical protein